YLIWVARAALAAEVLAVALLGVASEVEAVLEAASVVVALEAAVLLEDGSFNAQFAVAVCIRQLSASTFLFFSIHNIQITLHRTRT
ncbi:MAG: hypothetical protein ACI849_001370, partial [Patiriisocius sp.]